MAEHGPPDSARANDSLLVTLDEFAAMAGVPIATARHWRATEQGPKFKRIGRRVMARRADVIAWIDQQFEEAA